MSVNPTLNYLKSEQSIIVLNFSDTVATSNKYLKGAGGIAGDGFPMPFSGYILGIQVYDGSNVQSDTGSVKFVVHDRISVFAIYDLGDFTVYVRVNGINSAIYAGPAAGNTDLLATVTCKLTES